MAAWRDFRYNFLIQLSDMKTMRVFLSILLIGLIAGCGKSPKTGQPFDADKYTCPETCQPPSCLCPKISPPGNFSPDMVPQFVLLTIDGPIDEKIFDFLQKPLSRKNPDNCPVHATFFVTAAATDYWLANRIYAGGHEIAVQGMSGNTDLKTTRASWKSEIESAKKILSELGGIPGEKINGFRAPKLLYNAQSFDALDEEKFLYDSSMIENGDGLSKGEFSRIWPYTLDHGVAQPCSSGVCPDKNHPGLWEIPVYALADQDGRQAALDPEGDGNQLTRTWVKSVLQHLQGNRAPFGMFFHNEWFGSGDNLAALNVFMDWASRQDEVWFVTMQELIDYLKKPVSKNDYANQPRCPAPEPSVEICDGRDNNGDGNVDEGLVHTCKTAAGSFRTCAACPALPK